MINAQLALGGIFLFFSMLLRNWGKVNLRLPKTQRPLAFQNRKFDVFLEMVWEGLLVIGLLLIFLIKVWAGILAFLICFFVLSPRLVFSFDKALGYDKVRVPPREPF
jgi:hypothetical protein